MSVMRAVAARRSLALMPRVAGARGSAFLPSTPEEWEAAGYEVSPKNGAPKIPSLWNKWFPYEPVPYSPKLGPYLERVEAGKTYLWCSCGESLSQPWCDDDACSHKKFKPVPYTARHSGPVLFCGSKHSPGRPLFNGTCYLVWANANIIPACMLAFASSFVGGTFLTWWMHP
mmetsp:Transcript_62229/g.98679  ORF Transcript_62229/g.98679 Transcript_62229/m.98679 type:complete len:172 (+) Transcript_62229:64-579(+)